MQVGVSQGPSVQVGVTRSQCAGKSVGVPMCRQEDWGEGGGRGGWGGGGGVCVCVWGGGGGGGCG